MVRDVLAEPGLSPEVRDLAVERLEARLLQRARALLGEGRDLAVSLGDDGVARVTEGAATLVDPRLDARLDMELVASLAAVMGAARADVKNGERATPRAPARAPVEPVAAPSWEEVTRRLARVVALQHRRIEALEAALAVSSANASPSPELREISLELQGIEEAVQRLSKA